MRRNLVHSQRFAAVPCDTTPTFGGQNSPSLSVDKDRATTPLQIAEHLNRAFEEGFRLGQKPVTPDIVTATLAPDFDSLEPRLMRQGYSVKVQAEQFSTKPAEILRLLDGSLEAARTRELADLMRAAGLPL